MKNKSAVELYAEFKAIAGNVSKGKAPFILDSVHNDGDTHRDFQGKRDFITQSIVRDLEHQIEELAKVDAETKKMLDCFGMKLTTISGVGTAIACKLIAEIGEIRRFPNADKLARFAGIAPIKFRSAGKGKEQSSKQGNRKLHGLFYFLAVSMVCVHGGKPNQPIFYAY